MSIRGERSGKGKAIEDNVPKRAPIPDLTLGDLKLSYPRNLTEIGLDLNHFLLRANSI